MTSCTWLCLFQQTCYFSDLAALHSRDHSLRFVLGMLEKIGKLDHQKDVLPIKVQRVNMSPKWRSAGLISYRFQTTEVCVLFFIYTIYLRKVYTFGFLWNVNLIVFCMLLPFHLYLRVFLGSTQVFWIAKNGDPDGFFIYVSAVFVLNNLQLQVRYLEIECIIHV